MKVLTYEEWQKNPTPREMWVWNDDIEAMEKRKVVYVIKDDFVSYPVLVVSEEDRSFGSYRFCAEIEKPRPKPKKRRMTNQELAWWLQEGKHREFKYVCGNVCGTVVYNSMDYLEDDSNSPVNEDILIRENGGEWHLPLVEVEE